MDSFFGIGAFELVFIIIFALIFLGPERLPSVLRDLIGFLRQIRDISSEVTQQFTDEFGDLQELQELDPRRQIQKAVMEPKGKRTERKSTTSKKQTASKPASQQGTAQQASDKKTPQPKTDTEHAQMDARLAFGSGATEETVTEETRPESSQKDAESGAESDTASASQGESGTEAPPEETASRSSVPRSRSRDTQISPASAYFAQREVENGKASEPAPESKPEQTIAPPSAAQPSAEEESSVKTETPEEEQT